MTRQWTRLSQILLGLCAALALCLASLPALARTREPNNIYAERRARLRAQLDGPVVLFGFTGKENSSPSYIFAQQEDFYYLTGHNEEGAALLLIPATAAGKSWAGPAEILFLPQRNPVTERWDGPRMGPTDSDASERVGSESVQPFSVLKGELENLSKVFTTFYAILPKDNERGYPHSKTWANWLSQVLPQSSTRDISAKIAALRQVKSPSEIELLTRAIDLSVDAHFEAMKTMRPGIYEYQVAARMEYVMKSGGCEGPAYAPIVGSGFYSTVLHYNDLTQKIQPGEIAVLDVGCSYSGYAADITRTLPADGKFTPRQREIYEIVLGAQNAALAALKPGMTMGRGPNGLQKIAFDYINTHGKDKDGKPLGRYFIHGLGHHIGLNVHDAGLNDRPLESGMVITIEPGIYIPEENLGVRIEDDVLITETGYKLLSARLPRTVDEVERIMAVARKERDGKRAADVGDSAPASTSKDDPARPEE